MCSKFGTIEKCFVEKNNQGNIWLKFSDTASASNANTLRKGPPKPAGHPVEACALSVPLHARLDSSRWWSGFLASGAKGAFAVGLHPQG